MTLTNSRKLNGGKRAHRIVFTCVLDTCSVSYYVFPATGFFFIFSDLAITKVLLNPSSDTLHSRSNVLLCILLKCSTLVEANITKVIVHRTCAQWKPAFRLILQCCRIVVFYLMFCETGRCVIDQTMAYL